jgi:hypothetical protein
MTAYKRTVYAGVLPKVKTGSKGSRIFAKLCAATQFFLPSFRRFKHLMVFENPKTPRKP